MPNSKSLSDLSRNLAAQVSVGAAAIKSAETSAENLLTQQIESILRVNEVSEKIAAGERVIRVMELCESSVASSHLSGGELSEYEQERVKRVRETLANARPDWLVGLAAAVFQTLENAQLHPQITTYYEYDTTRPFIIIRPQG